MTEQRYRDARTRSPARPRNRERDIEESQHRHPYPYRGSGSVRSEPERHRAIDSFERRDYERAIGEVRSEPERDRTIRSFGKRDYDRHYDDGHRDEQMRKPSQFNESSSRGESPSMEYRWNQILAGKSPNSGMNPNLNSGLGHTSEGYGNETSRIRTEKGYQRSGYSDLGVFPKSEYMHTGNASTYSKYSLNDGNTKIYGHFDSGFKSPSSNSNLGLYQNEDFRLGGYSHSARALCKEEEKPPYGLRDTSYMIPNSQTKAFATASSGILKDNFVGGSYKDGHPLSSFGFSRSNGMLTEPVGHDGYGQKSLMKSYTNSELLSKEMMDYRQPQKSQRINPNEDTIRVYKYAEERRSERTDLGILPDDHIYDKIAGDREDYKCRDQLRTSIGDSIVDRIEGTSSSYGDGQRESYLYEHNHFLQEKSIPSYLDVTRVSRGIEHVREVVSSGSTHFKYGIKGYEDTLKRLPMSGRDQGFYEGGLERSPISEHDHQGLYEDSLKRLPKSRRDQGFYEGGLERSPISEHDHQGLYEDSLKRLPMSGHDQGLHEGCLERSPLPEHGHQRLYEDSLKRFPMSGHDHQSSYEDTLERLPISEQDHQGLYEYSLKRLPTIEHDHQGLDEDMLKRLPTSEHDLYEDSLKSLQMSERNVILFEAEGSLQQMSRAEELGLHDIYEKMLKRKGGLDEETSVCNPNSNLSHNLNAYDDSYDLSNGDEQWPDGDIEQMYLSKALGFNHSHVGEAEMKDEEMVCHGIAGSDDWLSSPDLQVSMQRHTGKPIKSARRDIKKRLGPAGRDMKKRLGPAGRDVKKRLGPAGRDVKKRLGPAGRDIKKHLGPAARDIKKRLGPAIGDIKEQLGPPQNFHRSNPFLRKYKQYQYVGRICDDCSGSSHTQVGNLSKVEVKPAKYEPPEDSEEFKHQVNCEFLKFSKLLNENSAQRSKYTENGGTGTLKCSICSMRGSNSKEYIGTLSLVKHSFKYFKSRKIGSRAQHLGFHKALCVLMGWSCAMDPNNKTWVHHELPDAEALVMKEDLVIWPPVVIVHNSSIANNNPDERVIISIEGLEAILRDMGFDGGKTKVCRGKPANQSIMVVSFNGTFSGLLDAERLHKFYAENKHGKAEFQKMNFSSSGESQKMPADQAESVLYGYLGTAGDLYKLDFEAKKRSVVKSKKDILAIADSMMNDRVQPNYV